MVPIGAVLILLVVAFTVAVLVSNPAVFDLSLFGAIIPVTTGGVFLTGGAAMLVLIVGIALIRAGLRRSLTRRREVRALRSAAEPGPTTPAVPTTVKGDAAAAEREALLDEAEELTGDGRDR